MKNNRNSNKEIFESIVYVNRVTKVVKGGRNMSFSAIVLVGDKKGSIGMGFGKAPEVIDAREKASRLAKKTMFRVPLRENRTIHHDITIRYGATKICLRSAPAGTGVIAGSSMRVVFELLGVKDVVAKIIGSNNPHNVLKALLNALKEIESPKQVANRRSKKLAEINAQRYLKRKTVSDVTHSGEASQDTTEVLSARKLVSSMEQS